MKVLLQLITIMDYYFLVEKTLKVTIEVYRANDYNWGVDAVAWAKKNYYGKQDSVKYKITSDLKDTKNTYCSKIVFQAYRFGVGYKTINQGYFGYAPENLLAIYSPYDLPSILLIGRHGEYDASK